MAAFFWPDGAGKTGLALLHFDDGMPLRGCQAVPQVAAAGGAKRSDAVASPSAAAREYVGTAGSEVPPMVVVAGTVLLSALHVAAMGPLF